MTPENTSLVLRTDFENLLARIEKEKVALKNSEFNKERRRRIVKTIGSVYYFLRRHLGMSHQPLSYKDFKIAEKKLREIAEQETKKLLHRMLGSLGIKTNWMYFLEHGHFKKHTTPFGCWEKNERNPFWGPYRMQDWYSFNIDDILKLHSTKLYSYSYFCPPNLAELLEKLFEEQQVKTDF